MRRTAPWRSVLPALALAGASVAAPPPVPSTFEKDVLPLFRSKCLACHGAGRPSAGLDLRTRGGVLLGSASGKVVDTNAPARSKLLLVMASGTMPPGPQKVSAADQRQVLAWIQAGAKGSGAAGHWAFTPPVRPRVPKVAAANTPIDAFLLAKLATKGQTFSPEADRRTLIRRVTFDLTGLPPTPEEVDAFVYDTTPDAYEKVVDRLLVSPAYGETWARFWLDLAGYADSEGVLQEDRIRPNAWRYRDYVIKSLNDDKPYDQFLKEQIAGDELSGYRDAKAWTPQIEEKVVATGFLRTAVDATRDDFNEHQFTEYQYRMLHDTQTILVSATLALTVQCARCHDHKYEPISQKDYYGIQAILSGAIRPRGKLLPTYRRQIVAATAEDQKRAAETNAQVEAALAEIAKQEAAIPKDAPDAAKRKADLAAQRAAENRKRVNLPEIRALYDQDAAPPPTQLLHRGEIEKPGEAVPPGIPRILDDPKRPFGLPTPPPTAATTGRRSALANWIANPANPLTARAIVNRLWARHFSAGLALTTENLGVSGAPPSHPELLDWLATELIAQGWRLKPIHRQIVLSRAYRQASAVRPEAARRDPENRLLWRFSPRRIDAEAVRDSVLAVAGTLDRALYGEPIGVDIAPTGEVVVVGEEGRSRRSVYVQVRRTAPVTVLNAFDAPVMETNCTRRVVSATPTQALTLLNSRFLDTQSTAFAKAVLADVAPTKPATEYAATLAAVDRAFRRAYERPPTDDERRAAVGFLNTQTRRYAHNPKTAADADRRALADLCLALMSSNEFLYVD